MLRMRQTRARRIVDALVLPDPWSSEALIAQTARQRGRLIRVERGPAIGDAITGAIFRLSGEDVIFYRGDLVGIHRDHVLCHELAHLLAGHLDGSDAYFGDSDEPLARAYSVMLSRQWGYGEARERVAENIAEMIMARVRQQIPGVRNLATGRAIRGFGSAMR